MNTLSRGDADLLEQLVEQAARRGPRTACPGGPRRAPAPRRRTSARRRRCPSRTRRSCAARLQRAAVVGVQLAVELDELRAAFARLSAPCAANYVRPGGQRGDNRYGRRGHPRRRYTSRVRPLPHRGADPGPNFRRYEADRYLAMRELERIRRRNHSHPARRSGRLVDRHRRPRAHGPRARGRAARRRATRSASPAGRGEIPGRRRDRAVRARRRDRRRPRTPWPAPRRSSATRAAPRRCARSTPPAPRRSALHPLQTVHRRRRRPARLRLCHRGLHRRGAGSSRATSRSGSGWSRSRSRDEQRAAYHAAASIASNFLVTLEWAARRRVAGGAGIAPTAPLSARSCARPSRTGSRSGRDARAHGPVARGDEATVAAQRAAVADAAPELLALFDALAERTRELARMKTVRDRRRAARGARARRAAPAARSASCRRWASSTRATSRSCARARRGLRPRRRLAVREPGPVRPGRGPRRLPARRGARPRRSPRPRAWTSCSRPPVEEVYPDGLRARRVEVLRPHRGARRRPVAARPGPLRRASRTVVDEALQHGPAGRAPTSARRTRSRRS